jgi:transcriptional regulator with XRE-family HTH domain
MNSFRIKLKEARLNKGLKQSDLAKLLGTKQQIISQYETGADTPSLERLVQFAQILEVTLDELVEFDKIHNMYSKNLLNTTKIR